MDSSILVKYLWFTAVRGLARKTLVTFWWCLDGGGRNFFFEMLQKIPSTFDFGSGFYTSQVKKMIEAEA